MPYCEIRDALKCEKQLLLIVSRFRLGDCESLETAVGLSFE